MADYVDNRLFWFCLVAKKPFMCDDIYWAFLDKKYFETLGDIED